MGGSLSLSGGATLIALNLAIRKRKTLIGHIEIVGRVAGKAGWMLLRLAMSAHCNGAARIVERELLSLNLQCQDTQSGPHRLQYSRRSFLCKLVTISSFNRGRVAQASCRHSLLVSLLLSLLRLFFTGAYHIQ